MGRREEGHVVLRIRLGVRTVGTQGMTRQVGDQAVLTEEEEASQVDHPMGGVLPKDRTGLLLRSSLLPRRFTLEVFPWGQRSKQWQTGSVACRSLWIRSVVKIFWWTPACPRVWVKFIRIRSTNSKDSGPISKRVCIKAV